MSSSFWEPEQSLILRSYFLHDKKEDGTPNYETLSKISSDALVASATLHFAQSVIGVVYSAATTNSLIAESDGVLFDADVPTLLPQIDSAVVDIASVASSVGYIFSKVRGVEVSDPIITSDADALSFTLAAAVATASVIKFASRVTGQDEESFAQSLYESLAAPVIVKIPRYELITDQFQPTGQLYNVENIIRLDSEYEDHNIDAVRTKSLNSENNLPFVDLSRSLAAFCWSINRSIDTHKTDDFVYDFSLIGTEHVERMSRSWGIRDVALLSETIEVIMNSIGSIYESGEQEFTYAVPNTEHEEYETYRYLFHIALAAISTAHVGLFSRNFGMTRESVYGEVRRVLKEVENAESISA